VTDDPSRTSEQAAVGGGAASAAVAPYLQIVEVTATPLNASEAIDEPDEQGRVPVMVRIRRQAPINPIWILVAIGLSASGVFLPLTVALRAMIIVAAVVALFVGLASRLFMRIPPGTVGLVARAGRHQAVLDAGIRRVNPALSLTHVVTTRELAFDVPVAAVRSSDGVNVNVDLVLTLGISDPVKLAYSITTRDLDQFIHATCQEAVRLLVRGIEALTALDLGPAEADRLRQAIDAKLAAYGVDARAVAFTRVLLPEALTASLEAKRLSAVQLSEEQGNFALEERRLSDRANLIAMEQDSRRKALELESEAEALRLGKLEERLRAYPLAARYDLETQRLQVAQQLAGNTRAVVSLGANDLLSGLLTAQLSGDAMPQRSGDVDDEHDEVERPTDDGQAAPAGEPVPARRRPVRDAIARRTTG
jgi:regulator of protease activity HflC (stomatin/prohibitin superfamily)